MRSRNCRATITALEQAMLDAQGPVNGVQHNAAFSAGCPGDAWNPKPQVVKQAQRFSAVSDQRRAVIRALFSIDHRP